MNLGGPSSGLAIDTPIPTATGWSSPAHVQVGESVFDERGDACTVIASGCLLTGRSCCEIDFSDGSSLTVGADQEWLVGTRKSRLYELEQMRRAAATDPPRKRRYGAAAPQVMRTSAMIGSVDVALGANKGIKTHRNYSVPLARPLCGGHVPLVVPPYTFGAWLGDGSTRAGAITSADHAILAEIELEGETLWLQPSSDRESAEPPRAHAACLLAGTATTCSPSGKVVSRGLCVNHWNVERRAGRLAQWPTRHRDMTARARVGLYTVAGLAPRLRMIGVFGDKHIPAEYLRASEEQRRALLAGLLDTDGYCQKQGTAEFYSTKERLARDAHHLACTLGYNASLTSKRATLRGKDCGRVWIVRFTTSDKVFRLVRKLERLNSANASRSSNRYITSIRPVPTVPLRNIAVDSPSGQFLAGSACIAVPGTTP